MKRSITFLATIALLASSPAHGHFPWVTIDEKGNVAYFFGETPADRTYKLPPSIKKAEVLALATESAAAPVELKPIETKTFVGMSSTQTIDKHTSLASKVTYGIYHGSRLDYYTQHIGGKLPTDRNSAKPLPKGFEMQSQIVDTDSGVDVFVTWKGEPLVGAQVRLFCDSGHEEASSKTDEAGKVSFTDREVEDGLNGIMVGSTAENESGQIDGASYKSVSRYLTATFVDPEDFEVAATSVPPDSVPMTSNAVIAVTADEFPAIPELVTSFGAAVTADSIYIYGGHTGRAHEYYQEAQANTLWRLDRKHPKAWQSLGSGPRLQGLALVTHGGKLYRLGGFTARNKDGEDKDLWSQNTVACYAPEAKTWTELAPLPEPRSSFDAAVLDGKIYVVGGWNMQGDGETKWHETAYCLDLAQHDNKWEALPNPPFQRRALSIAAHQGKLYVIGGMQRRGGPTTRVDVFDPKTKTWSKGPSLNGQGMDGFGSSSFAVGGELFVSTYSGALQKLAEDGQSWTTETTLDRARFFHRMLPLGEDQLIAIGGASMSEGKFDEVDVIEIR